jgi:FkbM family methyltransferase
MAMQSYYQWISLPNILVHEYNEITSNPLKCLEQISNYLNTNLDKNILQKIINHSDLSSNKSRMQDIREFYVSQGKNLELQENALLYDPRTLLHWNHIRPGEMNNWKSVLKTEEIDILKPVVSQWLIDAGYENDDNWEMKEPLLNDVIMNKTQFVSYAQNYEDVMLWRALKHVENGFYVDVGANDPKIDSVTQAFYERGWHGINIEPMQSYYEKLCSERSRDINLGIAVGSIEGEMTFYDIPNTGLSSVLPTIAQINKPAGREIIEYQVHVSTLNQIFDEHVHEQIHFLKIDVEGFEKFVLEGLDLSRWRPWIIVIEANKPGSAIPDFESWEEMILSSAYKFVYFDGLNRFYIAEEHSELANQLKIPPNVFDEFIHSRLFNATMELEDRATILRNIQNKNLLLHNENKELQDKNHLLENENIELQNKIEDTLIEINSIRRELGDKQFEIESIKAQLNVSSNELNSIRAKLEYKLIEIESFKVQLDTSKHEADLVRIELEKTQAESGSLQSLLGEVRSELNHVYHSRSYRITAPLRAVAGPARVWRERIFKYIERFFQDIKQCGIRLLRRSVNFLKKNAYFSLWKNKFKNRFPRLWHKLTWRIKLASLPQEPTIDESLASELTEEENHFFHLFQREIARYQIENPEEKK